MKFRIAAAILLFGDLLVGFWATILPRNFYDDFPGGGQHWVAADGPFNEHLLRDVGALNLALAVLAIGAILRPRRFGRMAGAAHLVWTGLHLAYHATHLDMLSTAAGALNVATLTVPVLAALFLVFFSPPDDVPLIDIGPSTA